MQLDNVNSRSLVSDVLVTGPHSTCTNINYTNETVRQHTEWAKKVSGCIAGCNFVSYGPI